MNECKFIPIENIPFSDEKKNGRYSQSMEWNVPSFGESKWVVLCYLSFDWVKEERDNGSSKETILKDCLSFLNILPEREKYQKKEPRPKYGKLEPYKADFKLSGKVSDRPYIIVQLITDEQSNTNFWMDGPITKISVPSRKLKAKENKETIVA